MGSIDLNEPPLFDIEDTDEPDVEEEATRGGLILEGVEIPSELIKHGNGRLPDSVLERIGIGRHRLHASAASAFKRWRESALAAGIDLTLTDSYRPFAEQVDLKKRKPGLAATPGKSVHGWGFAVDLSIGMPPKPFGQSVLNWLKVNGPTIGWHLGRPKDEPWHWVYRGPKATGDGGPTGQKVVEHGGLSDAGELAVGSSGERVRFLQQTLRITADGSFGAQTEKAVKEFQQRSALTADGRVGPKTWARLLATVAPADRPQLRRGSSGDAVRWVQRRLIITTDGDFGPKTEDSVKGFQRSASLTDDGVVGPRTWNGLIG